MNDPESRHAAEHDKDKCQRGEHSRCHHSLHSTLQTHIAGEKGDEESSKKADNMNAIRRQDVKVGQKNEI